LKGVAWSNCYLENGKETTWRGCDDLSILGSESHREDTIPSGIHAFRVRNISQPTNMIETPVANQIVEHQAHNYYQPLDYEYHE
jgi:hypothetical protein